MGLPSDAESPLPHGRGANVELTLGVVVIENDEGLLDILPILLISGIRTQSGTA